MFLNNNGGKMILERTKKKIEQKIELAETEVKPRAYDLPNHGEYLGPKFIKVVEGVPAALDIVDSKRKGERFQMFFNHALKSYNGAKISHKEFVLDMYQKALDDFTHRINLGPVYKRSNDAEVYFRILQLQNDISAINPQSDLELQIWEHMGVKPISDVEKKIWGKSALAAYRTKDGPDNVLRVAEIFDMLGYEVMAQRVLETKLI